MMTDGPDGILDGALAHSPEQAQQPIVDAPEEAGHGKEEAVLLSLVSRWERESATGG